MRVLITGGSGLLGKALIDSNHHYEILATYVGNYNMQDNDQVKYLQLDVRDKSGYINLFKNHRLWVFYSDLDIGISRFCISLKLINKYLS